MSADRLGGPLHGGLRQRQAGQPRQDVLGGLGEAADDAGQADGLGRAGGQVAGGQPEVVVAGAVAPMARLAVVVGPLGADRPQQADDALGAVADEAGSSRQSGQLRLDPR